MPKLFGRKSGSKLSSVGNGALDITKDPFNLRSREVKELNKPYDLKTHFVGVIDLCSTETHFPDLVLKLINRTCDELKDSSSKKSHKNEMVVSADQRYLLQEDDSASSEDESFGPSLPCESVKESERSVLTFNFSELLMRLGVPRKAPDAYSADVEIYKRIFRDNMEWKVLDEEGSYLFRALLPSKDTDKSFRLQHWLAGFLVVIDSEESAQASNDDVMGNSAATSDYKKHVDWDHLLNTLKSFKPILTYSRIVNNMFKKSALEVRKPTLVLINSTGNPPEMCPSNDNLENIPNACPTCLEIKSTYDCYWASDVTSACCILADQDIFKLFPEVIRILNMKMSGLY